MHQNEVILEIEQYNTIHHCNIKYLFFGEYFIISCGEVQRGLTLRELTRIELIKKIKELRKKAKKRSYGKLFN
jgi:hypothetical protein